MKRCWKCGGNMPGTEPDNICCIACRIAMSPPAPAVVRNNPHIPLRDYFAAQVLSAIAAGDAAKMAADRDGRYDETDWKEVVAANAYEFADAMIRHRDTLSPPR